MAALTATDWTVTVLDRVVKGKTRVNRCSMLLATVGTYPTGGIPIPTAISAYGMKQKLNYIQMYDPSHADGGLIKYSATGNVMRIYQVAGHTSLVSVVQTDLVEMATTATAGSGSSVLLYVEAVGF